MWALKRQDQDYKQKGQGRQDKVVIGDHLGTKMFLEMLVVKGTEYLTPMEPWISAQQNQP